MDRKITNIKGVGPGVAAKFAVLGVQTIADLVENFPRRYEDYSSISPISQLQPGLVTIKATLGNAKGRYVRRGMHITEVDATDATESVKLVWFNQPYRAASIKFNEEYFISGQYGLRSGRLTILNPSIELVSEFPTSTARIVPVYRETKGLTSKQMRKVMREIIPEIAKLPEILPSWLSKQLRLMPRAAALQEMHFPQSNALLDEARRSLGFEEVYALTLASLLNKQELLQDTSISLPYKKELAVEFSRNLPFKLTDDQRKTVMQIYRDMEQTQPMNRLVEGDVGSGKTVVAAMAALMAIAEGYQVALMAPTELLAHQHADTIWKLLEPQGLHDKLVLLVGGMKTAEKTRAYEAISSGAAQFVVGTHALIQDKVDMRKLGLVIIDEQHRFGVEQRKKLMAKAGYMPHLLSLTATPIPRSLQLTMLAELDVSILAEKPPGRQPVTTEICSPNSRKQLYEKIDAELETGRQMFVVCPLITESSTLEAASAEATYEIFRKRDFKHRRIGLLHGKMKPADKQDIMDQFVQHKLDILVSTTVIEVGVDVPNASIMLIEAADRFGLAQVHQLRGRVGRGKDAGFCYLMMSDSKAPPQRLRALERSNDGFKLAELDLTLRGPGAIYGTMQHGQLDLRVAKLTDMKLIVLAREAAQETIERGEDLLQYPELFSRVRMLRAVTNLN